VQRGMNDAVDVGNVSKNDCLCGQQALPRGAGSRELTVVSCAIRK
jgi:hypothetical protein